MDVESYATIHTLVSTIRGKKKDNVSPVECVRAAFSGFEGQLIIQKGQPPPQSKRRRLFYGTA